MFHPRDWALSCLDEATAGGTAVAQSHHLHPLENPRRANAGADAHRAHAVLQVVPARSVQLRGGVNHAGGAQRLTCACGLPEAEAKARSVMLCAYVFGVSLMRTSGFADDLDSLKAWIAGHIAP